MMKKHIMSLFIGIGLLLWQSVSLAASPSEPIKATSFQYAPIAAFAAVGDIPHLKQALTKGLDEGLTINPIKEILVQVYAYAGFPRSLNALAAFSQVLEARRSQGINDKLGPVASPLPKDKSIKELGTEIQTQVAGHPVTGKLMEFSPAIDEFLKAHLFGDIFARDNVSFKEREIATLGMLAHMSGVTPQLKAHLRISMNVGLTQHDIEQVIAVLKAQVGASVATHLQTVLAQHLKAQ
ncbi:carboxymuconolactone decarboxylase family protein [Celerinatantimonas sp. YJH-8]|uniref:carboxymuconolactone decarboxylase family protein n=1 Tax=Celerinatantimonas sp. YJH-8 TaxID=3228714 RepID=UPI0038BF3850